MQTKRILKGLKVFLSNLSIKSISLLVIFSLLLPNIISVSIFAVDSLNFDDYFKDSMDIYYNTAKNSQDYEQWKLIIDSRIEKLKADWEYKSIQKIEKQIVEDKKNGSTRSDEELREEYKILLNESKAEWEKDAEKHKLVEYGKWAINKLEIELKWENVNKSELTQAIDEANREYLYETDENNNYLYDEHGYRKIRSIETLDFYEDFAKWDEKVLGVLNSDILEFNTKLEEEVDRIKSLAVASSISSDIDLSYFDEYCKKELEDRARLFKEEREFLFNRERSRMVYKRVYDTRSMREGSEAASPEVISDQLLMETENELEKEIEKFKEILNAEQPDGTEEDIERFENLKIEIENAFKEGLNKWQNVEQQFVAERIMWEKNLGESKEKRNGKKHLKSLRIKGKSGKISLQTF